MSPLRDGAGEIEGIFIGAMVLIIDPNNPPTISLEPLKTLFNLTSAELNVAGLLLQGNTLMNVSEIRGVAIDRVKTQAKVVYAKTGVLNRALLIRKSVAIRHGCLNRSCADGL